MFTCYTLASNYFWVVVNGTILLNVYKTPRNTTSIKPLMNWIPPASFVPAGNFNSVHCIWQPSAIRQREKSKEIEIWGARHNLTCLIIDEPTHKAGNTLNLAWFNVDFYELKL